MKDNNMTFTFTPDEVGLILSAIAKLPFEQVANLFIKIQNDAQAQSAQAIPTPETDSPALVGEVVSS